MTTTYLSDDFENWSTGWTNVNPTLFTKSSTHAHGGTYSAKLYSVTISDIAYASRSFSNITTDHHFGVWIWIDSSYQPVSGCIIAETGGTGWSFMIMHYWSGGHCYLQQNALGTPTNICEIPADGWHHLEGFYNRTTGKIRYYLDNIFQIEMNSYSGANVTANIIYMGDISSTAYNSMGIVYWDDMVIDDNMTEPTVVTTKTKTYSIDVMFEKLGITKTDNIDVLLKKLGLTITNDIDVLIGLRLTKTDLIDVLFKKFGITATDSIDVLFKKLGIPATNSIDTILASRFTVTELIDMMLLKRRYTPYSMDVVLEKFGITKPFSIDTLFKKLAITGPTPLIDVNLATRILVTNIIDIRLGEMGITIENSIDLLLSKLAIIKTDSIDVLFKKLEIPITTSIDVILQTLIPPTPVPDVPETLKITNGIDTLWARPISWKENQSCNPAIRPVPLAESEYLDSDTWVLKPRTIECKIRLSDREKDVFESIYDAYNPTITTANNYLDFYLIYDNSKYIWHYLVWIREKSYSFDYVYQNHRYVRWWTTTLICDVQAFAGSSSTLPTWDSSQISPTYGYTTYLEDSNWTNLYNVPYYDPIAKAVKIGDQRLDHILDFNRDDSHPPMIPNWVNQLAEVDSYIWNECVLDTSYTCRMTNAEKYHMDLLLQAHTKVSYEDFIHNIFSPKVLSQQVPNQGAWVSSVEAQWDTTNWEKPWKVTIALQANNSETESRTADVIITSSYEQGTMYLDEVEPALHLLYDDDEDVGVHMLYFWQPAGSIWDYWSITGDAIKLISQGDSANGIAGEHILTVLIYGDCIISAIFHYPPVLAIILDSYLESDPSSHSEGLITIDGTGYSLPDNLFGSIIGTPYTLEFWLNPCLTSNVFDHWESSANITITDPSSASTTFTLDSGIAGTITAVYIGDLQIDIDYDGYSNPCNPAKITVDGIQYACPNTIYEFFGDWVTFATVSSGDIQHVFDHWEVSGGITVDDIYDASTIMHVTANGTLTAVFHNVVWEVISNHPSDPNQGQWSTDGSWWDNLPYGPYDVYIVDSLYPMPLHWRAHGNGGTFSHWSFTGGIHIADVNSANTTFWVSDSFTLTANYT